MPHDFICHHKGQQPEGSYFLVVSGRDIPLREPITKSTADALLKALCLHFKATGPWRARFVRAGVFLGGWASWPETTPSEKITSWPPCLQPKKHPQEANY